MIRQLIRRKGENMNNIIVKDIYRLLNAEIIGNENALFNFVSIDTREIKENSLYIGLKGERVDGNDLYSEAFTEGASVCLLEKTPGKDIPKGKAVLLVESTRNAILTLAEYYRSTLKTRVIAITGSTGKTSTKDILASILETKYKVFKTMGNFNNEIGLPLMIFKLDDTYDFAVLEMGMSQRGEIDVLARTAKPEIAIITNIGLSHIEHLKTKENIFKAKMEITNYFNENNLLVVNGDDQYLNSLKEKDFKVLSGGFEKGDYILENVKTLKEETIFTTNSFNNEIKINMPGRHNALNTLLSIIVASKLGIDIESLDEIKVSKSDMRMDIIGLKNIYVINDCYNANPQSMKAAIDYLSTYRERKVAILGTMKELGEDSANYHREVARYAKDKGIDILVAIGEYSKEMEDGFIKESGCFYGFRTFEEASSKLSDMLKKDDVILVKASRGMYFERFMPLLEEFGGK